MTNGNDFITPIILGDTLPNGEQNNRLTKREEFAKAAMQGILANPDTAIIPSSNAEMAVRQADALIKALNENT